MRPPAARWMNVTEQLTFNDAHRAAYLENFDCVVKFYSGQPEQYRWRVVVLANGELAMILEQRATP